MSDFLSTLAVILMTCVTFAVPFFIGGAFGYHSAQKKYRPCKWCGSDAAPRCYYGIAETWQCEDRDGCNARQRKS